MTKFEKNIILLILFGVSISHLNPVLSRIYPQVDIDQYDLFLSPRYRQSMTISWYVFEITNIINRIIWSYALLACAKRFLSRKAFYISCFLFFYYLSQVWFYIWDRCTNALSITLVFGFVFAAILLIFVSLKSNSDEANNYT